MAAIGLDWTGLDLDADLGSCDAVAAVHCRLSGSVEMRSNDRIAIEISQDRICIAKVGGQRHMCPRAGIATQSVSTSNP